MACTHVAAPCSRPGRCTGAAAGIAFLRHFDRDLGGLAGPGIFQRDFQIVTQIGTAPRLLAPTAAAECAAKNGFENIAQIAEFGAAAKPAAARARTALLKRRMTKPVIGGTLLRVGQYGIGRVDLLEPRLGLGIAGVLVRVVPHGKAAERRFDRLVIRGALDFEQFVKIDLGRHQAVFRSGLDLHRAGGTTQMAPPAS